MITMQYKITLPSDYDMNIIKDRVKKNGFKTDGFDGLKFKCYLITEKNINYNQENSYSPLYFWCDVNGMNKFVFNGFYDNIINSFGWQKIETNIPIASTITTDIKEKKYAIEIVEKIEPTENMLEVIQNLLQKYSYDSNYLILYNPLDWVSTIYYFCDNLDYVNSEKSKIYTILHVSTSK